MQNYITYHAPWVHFFLYYCCCSLTAGPHTRNSHRTAGSSFVRIKFGVLLGNVQSADECRLERAGLETRGLNVTELP
jgi:hypothetical protein